MKRLTWIFLIPLLMGGSCEKEKTNSGADPNPFFRILFYNVENLFDAEDDPVVDDAEFLPGSEKQWTELRYHDKLDKIAEVISLSGGDTLPVLVGLCEVENRKTLTDLLSRTLLGGKDYTLIHQESPDRRGIDVALLYRSTYFTLLNTRFHAIRIPSDTSFRTRDILYASGLLAQRDTIHLFVGHWPSRSGGEVESRPLRLFVANRIRECVDSIFQVDSNARIVVMGDFNDEPEDLSITQGLKAYLAWSLPVNDGLYELTPHLKNGTPPGTYKYRGAWNLLDHMVVSGSLLDTAAKVYVRPRGISVLSHQKLLEEDKEYMGFRPYRTYLGPYYHGGYSDHLPVMLNVYYQPRFFSIE